MDCRESGVVMGEVNCGDTGRRKIVGGGAAECDFGARMARQLATDGVVMTMFNADAGNVPVSNRCSITLMSFFDRRPPT